jgi:hypothetical protein
MGIIEFVRKKKPKRTVGVWLPCRCRRATKGLAGTVLAGRVMLHVRVPYAPRRRSSSSNVYHADQRIFTYPAPPEATVPEAKR